jgi:serine/threonine-protein kinase
MASVWAARLQGPRGFEKLVALKAILPHLADDPRFETMFLDEARIAAEIVHPNVAQVFELGEQDGVLYLVCEWVEGEPLSTLRRVVTERGERIPVPIALRIMADVCGGLHAAHELRDAHGELLQVVHRDVSPQNIVISDLGAVKVIDFGVAKALNRLLGETVAGKIKGKIQYMAPEQARGARVDRRADIWGVGAVLYHILSGRLPYEANSTLAILDLVLSQKPPDPLPPDIPASVADVVERALRIDPDERYSSAADMQLALVMALRDVSMPVTNTAIADYVRHHLGSRAEKRRKLVTAASEIADRAPMVAPDMTFVEYVTKYEGPLEWQSEFPESAEPDSHPDSHPGIRPDSHPGIRPDSHPGIHPDSHPGIRPDSHPGIHPDSHPRIHSDSHPGIHPDSHPRIHPVSQPRIHPASQPRIHPVAELEPEPEPEPVPLVRRSKPDWGEPDTQVRKSLAELRSLVIHTMPRTVPPPPMVEEPEAPPARVRSWQALAGAAVVIVGCVAAVFALSALRSNEASSGQPSVATGPPSA